MSDNNIEEPLSYLSRKELQLNIMRNIERKILQKGEFEDEDERVENIELKCWWRNTPNWAKVQTFLNGSSHKAGSTSSTAQCRFIGVDPDGKTFEEIN